MGVLIASYIHRFDLMAGFNGQEGGGFFSYEIAPMIMARNESLDDGCSMEMVKDYLHQHCVLKYTTQAPELCVDFIISLYGLDQAVDERDRAIRLTNMAGNVKLCPLYSIKTGWC